MGNERGPRWENGEREREREGDEESEGCSSVSALWSRASWDSRTLCQDSTLQNQSLSTEHKEQDAHVRTRTRLQTNVHSHDALQAMSSALVRLPRGSLSMSRQCVIAGRSDSVRAEQGCQITGILQK